MDKELEKITPLADLNSLSKLSSFGTVEEIARKLVSLHRPMKMDFRSRFGLPAKTPSKTPDSKSVRNEEEKPSASPKYFCSKCKKPVSEKVARFCWQNKAKFGGRLYCFSCQKGF